MRATGVIARFLPLLDVTLILLGLLMVTLAKAQLSSSDETQNDVARLHQMANVRFIYLYAGWKDEENGKCFLLGADWKTTREISTDTDSDIIELAGMNSAGGMASTPVVFLLFSEDGWYSAWPESRLEQIESVWSADVVPIYNVRIPP